jgi:hypothetical protein
MSDKKIEVDVLEEDVVVDIGDNESEVRAFDKESESRLKELQSLYEAEARKARELETQINDVVRFAHGTVNENKRLTSLLSNGERVLLDQAGNRVQAEMHAAEQAFKKAYEEGDTELMLKAQKAIADLTHQMKQVESYASTPTQYQQPQPVPAPQRPQPQVDEKSDAWIKKNDSWFMKDRPMTGFAFGVHEELVRSGVKPGTDKYIEELDRRMGEAFPDKFQSAQSPKRKIVSGQSAVAPATRTAGGKSVVRVTPTDSQRDQARRIGVPIEAYMAAYIKEYGNG